MKIKNIQWTAIFIIINPILINWILYLFINLDYPLVGHDYSLTIPAMLDILIFFRNNGFIIQWYTPSFGGGIPAFPDPGYGQFSLLGILPLWMNPWQAVFISSIIFVSLGFFASYRFFQKVLKLSLEASVLGAVFFSANGLIMQRIAAGHAGYQLFPLLAIILLLFLDPALPASVAGLLLGAVVALLVHEAGYFLVVIFGLSSLMIFPLVHLFQPGMFSLKRFTITLVFGGLIGLLLSASKLSAVYSFMRFFPRLLADVYSVNSLSGIFGIALQLLGTMNLVPLFAIGRLDPNMLPFYLIRATGATYGYWEFDISMSPVVFGIILAGMNQLFHAPRKYFKKYTSNKKWIAALLFIFFTWLCVEFTLAAGWFYPYLRQLPILSSLHVNARFAAAFLFPIALLAAVIYNSWARKWPEKKSTILFILLNLLTLLPLSTYFMFKEDLQWRVYDISPSMNIYQSIRAGEKFEVTAIGDKESNTQALQQGLSNLHLYNPIFGYSLENFHPEIKVGSVWDVSDGYFNMTNPSGYVFPESNNTRPFERIRVEDREKLLAFANYYQPDWEIPMYQRVCNWISALTFAFVVFFLGVRSLLALKKAISNQGPLDSMPDA